MPEFLPDGSLYAFIGVASVLFTMMIGCFLYHKGKDYFKNPLVTVKFKKKMKGTTSFKRGTRRNKFLMKKSERADVDEEGGASQSQVDKIRAEIDAKYNDPELWSTATSGQPAQLPTRVEIAAVHNH